MNAMALSPYWPHLSIPGERRLRPAACRERPDGASRGRSREPLNDPLVTVARARRIGAGIQARATGLLCSAGAALRYRDAEAGMGGGLSPTWVADRQPSSGSGTAFASMRCRWARSRSCRNEHRRPASLLQTTRELVDEGA